MNYREQAKSELQKWSQQVVNDLVMGLLEEYPDMDYTEARWWATAAADGLARDTFARSAAGLHT